MNAAGPPGAKTGPGRLRSSARGRLSGDLDNIVLKALRKEPERRYASVEQFSEDIRRHLAGLPVNATPDTVSYRLNKFVRRHKAGVAGAALVVVVLVGGIVATTREARIAAAHQRRAEKRFNEVRKLANSLMFETHDSIQTLPGATEARKAIVQRSQEYLDSLAQESSGDVSLQRELGASYEKLGDVQGGPSTSNLGDYQGALASYRKAFAIRQAVAEAAPENSDDQLALAADYARLGTLQWFSLGSTTDGLDNLQKAVALSEAIAAKHPDDMKVLKELGAEYSRLGDIRGGNGLRGSAGRWEAAREDHEKALALLQRVVAGDPSNSRNQYLMVRTEMAIGDDYMRLGGPTRALEYYRRAEAIIQPLAKNSNDNLYTRGLAICFTRTGDALLTSNRPLEALEFYKRELEELKLAAAADPKDIPMQLNLVTAEGDIGHAQVEAGRVQEGKATLQRALAKTAALTKITNDSYGRALLASTEMLMGEAYESTGGPAREHYALAQDLYVAVTSADVADIEDAINLAVARNHLAATYLKSGDAGKAGDLYRKAMEASEAMNAAGPDNIEVLYALADAYGGMGDVSAGLAKGARDGAAKVRAWREANGWYEKSLATWQKVPSPSRISPSLFRAGDPRVVAQQVKKTAELAQDGNQ